MVCCLMISSQTAWADGVLHLAFLETFDQNTVQGGRDGNYGAGSGTAKFDNIGWTGDNSAKIYGANKCIRFGTGDTNGELTTQEIVLVGSAKAATLTFNAAGWTSGTNKLTITANEGVTLSGDTQVTLTNSSWTEYTVNITSTTAKIQLTFTGKRGFLDDVKVTENVTAINAPTLTDEHLFWSNTTETPTKHITLVPSDSTTVYYTTDGTTPSKDNGQIAMLTSNISITGTTTVKAIAYYESVASSVTSKTYTVGETVNDIEAFCEQADNMEVRLHLADDASHETRVLYYDETRRQLFLRENTKALCIDFGSSATFNPTPQYNQHIAGWIVGKKTTDNGMPKLVATDNTTTDFLAIADRVTEEQTAPANVSNGDLSSHAADWVTIMEQRVGEDLAVIDRYGTEAYDGALTDLSGIVIPDGSAMQIAPITQNNIPGVIYVIDQDKAFTSPAADIANATVRLKRTLSKDYWNTFVVPFDIPDMEAAIREYTGADGNNMHFTSATSIEAGTPYLVKPTAADITNPTYTDVTLKSQAAKSITYGDYKFAGTYSPQNLATDKTELFITTNGKLGYPTIAGQATLKGMRAYIEMLNGTPAPSMAIEGDATGIAEVRSKTADVRDNVYDLQGRKVLNPGKGLYIVNGKKIIIQ